MAAIYLFHAVLSLTEINQMCAYLASKYGRAEQPQREDDAMSFCHTPTSTERSPGRLETKLSDGKLLGPPDTGRTDALAALCGFVPVVDAARPADTASVTYDRSITLPGGVPTVTWA